MIKMDSYTPRVSHFLIPLLIVFASGALLAFGWTVAAWFGFYLAGLSGFFIVWVGWLQTRIEHIQAITSLAHELQILNPEQYRALGIRVPELRIYSGGAEPIAMVEDRNLKYTFLRELLLNCGDKEFAPSSTYDKETIALRQWKEAANLLMERKYLIVGSAAGNHTLFWHGGGRAACVAAYFGSEEKLRNAGGLE